MLAITLKANHTQQVLRLIDAVLVFQSTRHLHLMHGLSFLFTIDIAVSVVVISIAIVHSDFKWRIPSWCNGQT